MKPEYPERVALAHLPTPLEKMERLTAYLKGPRLYIKRDDCSGLALGGNKARKLEFYVGDAIAKGATTLLTTGAVQSNYVRCAAAAAAKAKGNTYVTENHQDRPKNIQLHLRFVLK